MKAFDSTYADRRVLVTGHTGFKGSWLCAWLEGLGASVAGYALDPNTDPNHFDLLDLQLDSHIADVRDAEKLTAVLQEQQPEIIFHLAAQPLVLASYEEPVETFTTNIIGTLNLLEAIRRVESVRAVVVVTTDKCYENKEWSRGYHENDRLGGHDPYSASKACVELVSASYRQSFFQAQGDADPAVLIATARAGNVIGGGDWVADRLIPDAMRAAARGEPVGIRNPASTRPWQHVLEPLSGYLLLGQRLLEGRDELACAWNFGPPVQSNLAAAPVVERASAHWPAIVAEQARQANAPHEASLLMLDSTKARRELAWRPVWSIDPTLKKTVDWYRLYYNDGQTITTAQIDEYMQDALGDGAVWAAS